MRVEAKRLLDAVDRLAGLGFEHHPVGQHRPGVGVVGVDPERGVEFRHRLAPVAAIEPDIAEDHVAGGIVGVQRDRLAGGGQRQPAIGLGHVAELRPAHPVVDRQPGMRLGEVGIELDRLQDQRPGRPVGLAGIRHHDPAAHEQVIGLEAGRPPPRHRCRRRQHLGERGDHPPHDLVLQHEEIGQVAVEALGPEMAVGGRLDQLDVDPHPGRGPPHAALDDVAHAQLAGDGADVDRRRAIGEARIAGDDEQAGDLRQVGDEVLDQPVGEIFLVGIAAHVGEGQHRDRRLARQRRRLLCRRGAGRPALPADPEDADRPGDVLDRAFAQRLEAEGQLAFDVVVDGVGHHDPAGLGEAFQPHRDIDAVAEDVAILDQDVAEIDADAELQPAAGGLGVIARGHRLLQRHGAAHRVQQAGELGEEPVAAGAGDAAAMVGDLRPDHVAQRCPHAAERALLVALDQPGVAHDVGRENGGKPPLRPGGLPRFGRDDHVDSQASCRKPDLLPAAPSDGQITSAWPFACSESATQSRPRAASATW